MADSVKKYRVCGSQPIIVRGKVIPVGETALMTDKEAEFKLQIGAVELAPDAEGAVAFNTMAPAVEKQD